MKHWKTWKLAHAYQTIGSGTTPTSTIEDYYSSEEGIPWVTTSELRENYIDSTAVKITEDALKSFSALRIYDPGSLMIAMYGATIGRLGITTVPATCNQACCVFEKSEHFDNRFLFYWLWHRRADLIALSTGGGQPNLSQQDLREERALCPPLQTQRLIAQFLDQKTAQIDGLIEKKRALLERLAEKRQALITQAVTKGLNPNAPMKPSGIDWLGDIPAHWEVVPLKRTIRYQEGPGILAVDFRDNGIPLLRVASVGGRYVTLDGINYLDPEMANGKWGHFLTKVGDLLISASATSGIVSEVAEDTAGCIPYTGLIRVNPIENQTATSFIRHFLVSDIFLSQIEQLKAGSTIQHFGPYHLGLMIIVKPSMEEQILIGLELDRLLKKIDVSVEAIKQSIERLSEYRAATVSAAVTGQLRELL